MPSRSLESHLGVWMWIGWMFFYVAFAACIVPMTLIAFSSYSALFPTFIVVSGRVLIGTTFLLIVLSAVLPIKRSLQPQWSRRLGSWIIRCSHEYFNIKTIYENETAIAKHPTVLFLLEPHGVLPLSICGFIGLKYQPNLIGAISSACFAIPLMRHFYTWAGAESIDRKNLERNLSNGTSVVMCPGGVQETALVDTIPNTLRLYLKQRKGCIRLAMRQGVTIVPCFAFGTQNSFTLLGTSDQPWLKRLGRWLGALPMIVLGSFYLPLAPPPPADYVNVIGTPIEVGPAHTDQMMDEAKVERLLSEVIAQTEQLFAKHASAYGMGNYKLSIE